MAYFSIFSSDANLVDSFDREDEAMRFLVLIARENPELAGEYVMLEFDDLGNVVGDGVTATEAEARSSHATRA
jgi:hypothetical protein